MRPDLEPLPPNMQDLPVAPATGYPVPHFVPWIDGKPEFRAGDTKTLAKAIREKLCWVCGKPLSGLYAFVSGPMCCVNRTSAEPPSHVECARWSARNCPFLNGKLTKRRDEEGLVEKIKPTEVGRMITRNPGAAAVWVTNTYQPFQVTGGVLLTMGHPLYVEWYAHGRKATRAEVDESVRTGLPSLEELAMTPAAKALLARYKARFDRLLDKTCPNS